MDKRLSLLAEVHVAMSGVLLLAGWTIALVAVHALAWLMFWLSVLVLVPSLLGGIGLLRGQGSAKILLLAVSLEMLPLFPIGTALGIFGLWVLLQARMLPNRQEMNVLIVMAAVGLGFVVLIGGGLWISSIGITIFPAAGAIGVVAIAAFAFAIARLLRPPRRSRPAPRRTAIPVVSTVGSTTTTLCRHLQPIRDAMVQAGISMPRGQFACRVFRPALLRQFAPLQPVGYTEFFQPERSPLDNPTAWLRCAECSSVLATLHPAVCNQHTPWFPAPPPPLPLIADRTLASRALVTSVAASPDGRLCAVASGIGQHPKELSLWDVAGCQVARVLPSPGAVQAIAFSPDGRSLATCLGEQWDGGPGAPGPCVVLWDVESGHELTRFAGDIHGIRGAAFSPDGRTLLTSGMLGSGRRGGTCLDLWDVASGRRISRLATVDQGDFGGRRPYFAGVAFNGEWMLAASVLTWIGKPRHIDPDAPWWWFRGVRAWRVAGGVEVELSPHSQSVTHVSLAADGRTLVSAGENLRAWNLPEGTLRWETQSSIDYPGIVSPDGRYVVRGTGEQEDNHAPFTNMAVELFDARTGELLALSRHAAPVRELAFSNATLIAGGFAGDLRFWNTAPGTF